MEIIRYEQFEWKEDSVDLNYVRRIDEVVLDVITNVREDGDRALKLYSEQFDGVKLNELTVSEREFQEAETLVSEEFHEAIQKAYENIRAFHEAQIEKSWFFHKEDGIMLGQQVTPMNRVGIYIPGGKAAYPSTVLMNAIPATLANVGDIAITTPPQEDGTVNPHVLVAARLAGVERIYKLGGAQAIAALAYGTETVKRVDKIVGPGNDYVARAKKWVYGDVAIDMIAGPSEILIIADETAHPAFVAADLLSQAEHDEQAKAICVTTSESFAKEVQREVETQLKQLEREDIARASIETYGKIIVTETLAEAFDVANEIAPEHLQLMIEQATDYLPYVKHAGAIFLGNYSPEPLGDYMAGPNHTLPTSGTAAFASPLGVYDFVKKSSIIRYSEEALLKEAHHIETLANVEGLTGHAKSVAKRRN